MKKKSLINILVEIIYYLAMIGYMLVVKGIYSTAVNYDFVTFMAIALLFIGFSLLLGSHANKYFGLIYGLIYTLYLVAQKIYYRGFKSYFRFSTALELSKEVSDQGATIKDLAKFSDFVPFIVLIVIIAIFLLIRYIGKSKVKYRWYVRIVGLALIVGSYFVASSTVKALKAEAGDDNWQIYHTDYYLYDTVNNPEAFVEKFGLLTYEYRDAVSLFEQSKNEIEYKQEIDDYFSSINESSSTNEYTGIFKGKSLLLVQSESLMNIAIDPDLTPCLYSMINSSIEITNFDTPTLMGSTSDSEFMTNTSFIPESEGYSVCYKYVDNTYPITLGNLFKDEGYQTNAFHNNFAEYYNRSTTLANYGYEFMDSYALGLESESNDYLITEQIGWIDCTREKFASFWISYSGHSPYDFDAVGVSEENIARVREKYPDLDDEYVSYFAKIMDFDQSIQQFINIMEWTGRTNDVVIIIYGDHPAKDMDLSSSANVFTATGKNLDTNPELTYTPCFIYAPGIEHQTINKYCTCLDLAPTILNLWGIDYESKDAFGHDIMDDNYDGLSFDINGNIWNSNLYYDSTSSEIETYNGYSADKAQVIVDDFIKKRDICKKILKIDYFKDN